MNRKVSIVTLVLVRKAGPDSVLLDLPGLASGTVGTAGV